MLTLLPLLFFLAIIPFSKTLDLSIAKSFYEPAEVGRGLFVDNAFTTFFYNYGEWPGFALGTLALLVFLLSFVSKSFKKWRKGAWVVGLTLFLGSGVIVNGLLKEHVERPRPRQIEQFGGRYQYRPVYDPAIILKQNQDGQKSFPSGHVTMGFYFLSLMLVGKRYQNKILYYFGIGFTVIWGGSLIICRMTQGAHFFTDTLAAALIMWYIALCIDKITWEKNWFFLVLDGRAQ